MNINKENENKNNGFIFNFYIGENNTTHKREIKKAIRVFNRNGIKGFSVVKDICGYWEAKQEKSFLISVISNEFNSFNDNDAKRIKAELETELKQFLVLTTKNQLNLIG